MAKTQTPDPPDPVHDHEGELAGPFTTELELRLPMADVEAEVIVYDRSGEPCEFDVGRIVIRPIFFTAKQVVNALYAKLTGVVAGEQENLHRFVLTVSGHTGRCKMQGRSDPVTPAFATGAGDDDDDDDDDEDDADGPPRLIDQ